MLEIEATEHFRYKSLQKNKQLVTKVWQEFKILRLYDKARQFRYFVLKTTAYKGLTENVNIQKQLKTKIKEKEDKINNMILRRYFNYFVQFYKERCKYYEMATFVYTFKLKKNIFNELKINTMNKPLTKEKMAVTFYFKFLLTKGFEGFKSNLSLQIEKYALKLEQQNNEIADIKFTEKMNDLKSKIMQEWFRYAHKKSKKRQKKARIALKEYFYRWKLQVKLMHECDKMILF